MSFRTMLAVRWTDCDAAGIVFYGNYYAFQEAATLEFFRSRGLSWHTLQERYGAHFPRVESHCTYTGPATYGDLIEVELFVPDIASKIMTLGFRVFAQVDQRKLCDGYVKFAMVPRSPENGAARALPLPEEFRAIFSELRA